MKIIRAGDSIFIKISFFLFFFLLPLFDVTKSWIHPVKKKGIKELISNLNVEDLRSIKQI